MAKHACLQHKGHSKLCYYCRHPKIQRRTRQDPLSESGTLRLHLTENASGFVILIKITRTYADQNHTVVSQSKSISHTRPYRRRHSLFVASAPDSRANIGCGRSTASTNTPLSNNALKYYGTNTWWRRGNRSTHTHTVMACIQTHTNPATRAHTWAMPDKQTDDDRSTDHPQTTSHLLHTYTHVHHPDKTAHIRTRTKFCFMRIRADYLHPVLPRVPFMRRLVVPPSHECVSHCVCVSVCEACWRSAVSEYMRVHVWCVCVYGFG